MTAISMSSSFSPMAGRSTCNDPAHTPRNAFGALKARSKPIHARELLEAIESVLSGPEPSNPRCRLRCSRGVTLMDALRRKFEASSARTNPPATRCDKPLKRRETKDPLDRLNDGYVLANFRRALRMTPSIPAGT
jgi:hypothetical protein